VYHHTSPSTKNQGNSLIIASSNFVTVCVYIHRGFVCSYVGANSVVGTARISQINKDGKTQQQKNP